MFDIIQDIEEMVSVKLASLVKQHKKKKQHNYDIYDKGTAFIGGAVASSLSSDVKSGVDVMKQRLYDSIKSEARPMVERMLARLRL